MPSIRIGFSTDLNLVNEQVGIGTTNPTARLDVRGQIRADNLAGGGGISTLTRYDGFLNKTQSLPNNVSIAQTTKGNLNSLSGEIVIDGEITVTEGTPLTGGRLDSLTVTGTFDLPHGGSEDREETPEKGSTRFNQDLGQLEFYTGYEWRTVGSYDGSGRGRGVFPTGNAAGPVANFSDVIDYVNIATLGNAVNFGTSTIANRFSAGCSSGTRGVFSFGYKNTGFANELEYITIASEGNSIDFGDSKLAYAEASVSSSTRGIWSGGQSPSPVLFSNVIDYVELGTLGNTIDFGDLTQTKDSAAGCASPTRGVFGGGRNPSIRLSEIDFITISSKGNAIDFGDLTQARRSLGALSNSTRGVFTGGYTDSPAAYFKTIDFITIASTGNAQTFGELPYNGGYLASTSSQTRGVVGGGNTPSRTNNISYVTIMSAGNALDFGDLTVPRNAPGALSDSHGGLGGF